MKKLKLGLILTFCLVPLGFGLFEAFTGLVLGYAMTIDDSVFDPGGYVYGTQARAYGAGWLVVSIICAAMLIRQFRRGWRESGQPKSLT